jgi:hypothetical protein
LLLLDDEEDDHVDAQPSWLADDSDDMEQDNAQTDGEPAAVVHALLLSRRFCFFFCQRLLIALVCRLT